MENKNYWNENTTEKEKEFWDDKTSELTAKFNERTDNTGEGEIVQIPTKIKKEVEEILEKNYKVEETLIKLNKELEEKEIAEENKKRFKETEPYRN